VADALTSITNLINSPPGQLIAGGVLATIVWKFFERVEAVLTDETKFEIAVWLLTTKPFDLPEFQPPSRLLSMFSMPSVQIAQRWKVLLNEEWLKKIWKPIGLFTCVLAATSLPLPNSIS